MPQYEHLRLARLPEQLERRKPPGRGAPYARERGSHSERLTTELDEAVETQKRRRRPTVITPTLILRVQTTQPIDNEEWERIGLTVLSSDADRTLVLFSNSDELQQFRRKIAAYGGDIPENQKAAPYSHFISSIEKVSSVQPRDRIGLRLREAGFLEPTDFTGAGPQRVLDVELWEIGDKTDRESKVRELSKFVAARGGEVFNDYIGPSITMLRVQLPDALVHDLLTIEYVATVDLPPEPDIRSAEALSLTLPDLPPLTQVDPDAPVIGIIDSGVNRHPMLESCLVGSIAVPDSLGISDADGHGTRVAGVAAFGDLRDQIDSRSLAAGARICSARVLNDAGNFDERSSVPDQMRKAITSLKERFQCRIFVIALGDIKMRYAGGKVGAWAATLDELARELDVLIFVSAGNRWPRSGDALEEAVSEYPKYLLEEENRFLEPAGAMNVVTVGALAHSEGIDAALGEYVSVRPITRRSEPSPFTRVGPGIGAAVKPELVDFGGTMVFDPATATLRRGNDLASAGVLTLSHEPVTHLFASGSGTSYAAPLVAFKASQLLKLFPHASANLIRALLVSSARLPNEALERLQSEENARRVCGHGQVDLLQAAYSDDSRVVLYAEGELPLDHFAVYELPIPEVFQSEKGRRTIRVTLSFDPPVRHTRIDYAGVSMKFRVKRGCDQNLIFEHYRKRQKEEGPVPEMPGRYDCPLTPGPQVRERATVQTALGTFDRALTKHGDPYYLVVRCESGWAADIGLQSQRFAIVVELAHEAAIPLYERLRVRLRE